MNSLHFNLHDLPLWEVWFFLTYSFYITLDKTELLPQSDYDLTTKVHVNASVQLKSELEFDVEELRLSHPDNVIGI